MTNRYYLDPLNLTVRASVPSNDILMAFNTDTIIPDFDVVVKAGGVEYVASCRDGKCDKCSADFSYDRVLSIFIRGAQHGLGLGALSVRLIIYGHYGECTSCPEPSYDLYSSLPYYLVDDSNISGDGASISTELAANFVTVTKEQYDIQCAKNPKDCNELATVIKNWGTHLSDTSKYRIFLMRKRRRSHRGTFWAVPALAKESSSLEMTWWAISAYSHKQPIFMGKDTHWLDNSASWSTIKEDGGYHLADVLNLTTKNGKFHNGRKKQVIGFAVFRYDERLQNWVRASNIATTDLMITTKGILICPNR